MVQSGDRFIASLKLISYSGIQMMFWLLIFVQDADSGCDNIVYSSIRYYLKDLGLDSAVIINFSTNHVILTDITLGTYVMEITQVNNDYLSTRSHAITIQIPTSKL